MRSHARPLILLAGLALLIQWALPAAGGASPSSFLFRSVGPDGGGFINVVAIDPSGSGLVLAGADLGGIERSTDFGQTWTPSDTGISGIERLKIASIVFSPDVPGRCMRRSARRGTTVGSSYPRIQG